MKSKSESIIIDKKEHAKMLAYALLQIQARIVNIPDLNHATLQDASNAILIDITTICILKMRELCTFLVEERVVKENELEYLLRRYIPYQVNLANMTEDEIHKIFTLAKEEHDKYENETEEEDKKFARLLNALKPDGPVH